MHYDLILKNGTIITPQKSFKGGDIAVKDEKIACIGKLDASDTALEVYDLGGKYILPGIIDAHVHFRDPGLTEKEDFETGSIAAAMGGITLAADMPNTIPVTSTTKRFKEKVKIASEKSYIDFALYALLNNDNLGEMEDLKKAGVLGFKVFFGTSTGEIASPSLSVLTEQLKMSAALGLRVAFHCETNDINTHFTKLWKEKCKSPDGIALSQARPVLSEILAMETVICLARYLGAKIHILHITCKDGAVLAAEAKKKGIDLTAETCPHYLLLNAKSDIQKVYPPIRGESSIGLMSMVKNGSIDMLATDHAPHTAVQKNLPLWDAPAGLSGVETFVPLMLNEVNKGAFSLNDFVRLASEAPAKIWGIYPQKGSLEIGTDADFTIVDMEKKTKILSHKLHSKNKTTPYEGMEVQGCPTATIVRGKFVMKDGKLTGKKGEGKLIGCL